MTVFRIFLPGFFATIIWQLWQKCICAFCVLNWDRGDDKNYAYLLSLKSCMHAFIQYSLISIISCFLVQLQSYQTLLRKLEPISFKMVNLVNYLLLRIHRESLKFRFLLAFGENCRHFVQPTHFFSHFLCVRPISRCIMLKSLHSHKLSR